MIADSKVLEYGIRAEVKAGSRIAFDGWSRVFHPVTLREDESGFAPFRVDTISGFQSLAVESVTITGRTCQTIDDVDCVRVAVELKGDGEPNKTLRGWAVL